MGRYHVKVTGKGNEWYVMASLPTGVFTKGPMPEKKAVFEALKMQKLIGMEEERVAWWKKLFWWREKSVLPLPPPPSEPSTCPRHPQWKAELVGGKRVCGFCRKEIEG
jgi:hypothetical protein